MKLVEVSNSDKKNKRFKAIFQLDSGDPFVTHFGQKNPKIGTYIDHGDANLRDAYRKRHGDDHLHNPLSAGALSYWILWGDSKDINKNIVTFKRMFGV